jgi:hypothetical protein
MDPFYAFILFAMLVALETLAAQAWLPAYFRFGIPIYVRSAACAVPFDPSEAAGRLQESLKSSPMHPSIRFQAFNERQLAFREALFENRGGIKYLPVMHSLIRLRPGGRALTLTGYLNWSILAALLYLVYRTLTDRSFIPVAILVLFILTLSYVFQSGANGRVIGSINDLLGATYDPTHPPRLGAGPGR